MPSESTVQTDASAAFKHMPQPVRITHTAQQDAHGPHPRIGLQSDTDEPVLIRRGQWRGGCRFSTVTVSSDASADLRLGSQRPKQALLSRHSQYEARRDHRVGVEPPCPICACSIKQHGIHGRVGFARQARSGCTGVRWWGRYPRRRDARVWRPWIRGRRTSGNERCRMAS